jgi:dTDP-4-amino-4,6-dideoxygalactose transaminase
MKVPLADLHTQYLSIKHEIDSAIQGVIDSSQFILGKAVADFETAFARTHEMEHCVAVGSGTDALHLALWAAGIREGDIVVTSPFTFIATVEAILLLGAKPRFVDITPDRFVIEPGHLERLLAREPVKGIVPVHLYGQAAYAETVHQLAMRAGIPVVEDACQAHLAKCDGRYVGHFGQAACFSFYPGKNLGAYGESGAVLTNDDALAVKMRMLRDHGQSGKYRHDFWGHNYRMDGIQGAVLGVKLNYLKKWTERRRAIAGLYKTGLARTGDLILPVEAPDVYHVYHQFVIRTKHRDALQKYLAENGVGTSIAYPLPLHLQPAFQFLGYHQGDLPVSEMVAGECLSLPIYAEMTDEQVEYVVSIVKKFFLNSIKSIDHDVRSF